MYTLTHIFKFSEDIKLILSTEMQTIADKLKNSEFNLTGQKWGR